MHGVFSGWWDFFGVDFLWCRDGYTAFFSTGLVVVFILLATAAGAFGMWGHLRSKIQDLEGRNRAWGAREKENLQVWSRDYERLHKAEAALASRDASLKRSVVLLDDMAASREKAERALAASLDTQRNRNEAEAWERFKADPARHVGPISRSVSMKPGPGRDA